MYVPALCIQWWIDQEKFLYTLLPQQTSKYEFRLGLATTLFECGCCPVPIPYGAEPSVEGEGTNEAITAPGMRPMQ